MQIKSIKSTNKFNHTSDKLINLLFKGESNSAISQRSYDATLRELPTILSGVNYSIASNYLSETITLTIQDTFIITITN